MVQSRYLKFKFLKILKMKSSLRAYKEVPMVASDQPTTCGQFPPQPMVMTAGGTAPRHMFEFVAAYDQLTQIFIF